MERPVWIKCLVYGRIPRPLNLVVRCTKLPYSCATCGKEHDELPGVAFRWPDPYFDVSESERSSRIVATTDLCAIDDEDFFIRGVILIPIRGESDYLGIGVWVSQKRENFRTYRDNYDAPNIGPFFGWLCNRLPFYERDTWALKTMAHFQGANSRPLVTIEPSDHPLYLDYSEGLTIDRAWELAHAHSGAVRA